MELHVGRGTDREGLTIFPLWAAYAGPRRYSLDLAKVELSEREDGPVVGSLLAANRGDKPVLMLEGQLLEGGWQNRMLTRSVIVPAGESVDLDVVCVEQGRWRGQERHRARGRRGSLRVRNVDHTGEWNQTEVWRRVSEYDARLGASPTSSFADHADKAAGHVARLTRGLKPLPGQVGIVIGIAGHPVMAEVFDSSSTLHRQFDSIVAAAALDALGAPPVRTPARRAIRFVDRATAVDQLPLAPAGAGVTVRGESEYAAVTALAWGQRVVHHRAVNQRHPLNTTADLGGNR
jgi:hypothetical protein